MSVSTITSSDTPLALLSKVLVEGCLSSDDLVKFQVAVSAYVLSPAARQSLHQEIKKLSVAVMSIENDFATVFIRLKEVDKDNQDVVVDQEKRLIGYASKWEVLHNEYTHLTIKSQKTANKVSAKINQLLRVILPIIEDPSISIDKKEESLDDFIAGLNGYEGEEGKENAERLQHLKRNLYAFSQDLVQSGTSQRPDVQDRIKTLDEEIAQIQEDLESSSKFASLFTACWDVLKLSTPGVLKSTGATLTALGAAGALSATLGLATFLPGIGAGILVAGLIALGISIAGGVKKRAEQRQLQMGALIVLQREREEVALKSYGPREVLDQLHKLEREFGQTTESLGAIHLIWGTLNSDCQSLRNVLGTANNQTMLTVTVRNLKNIYETLQLALDQYCLAVAK